MTSCPCGSGRDLADCCGPILDGVPAPTAEALMRSRYSAFVVGRLDHLETTLAPEARGDYDPDHTSQWAEQATWRGLEIVDTVAGGVDDATGEVEFIARFRIHGQDHAHHERSSFRRIDDIWHYVDGFTPKPETRVVGRKVGRNEPCPCGSGKKYKKCCGSS